MFLAICQVVFGMVASGWGVSELAAPGGIRGVAVDPTNAYLPNSLIRLLSQDGRFVRYRCEGQHDGSFRIIEVQPGAYILTAWAQGFREKRLVDVVVKPGRETDLGAVALDLAGCDAPGVICHFLEPGPPRTYSQGELEVPRACAVELDKGGVVCQARSGGKGRLDSDRERGTDFKFEPDDHGGLFLSPMNGAWVALPKSDRADCDGANYTKEPVPIDGLGRGGDICVRTSQGRFSHLFLQEEVRPESRELRFSFVTW